MLPFNRCAYVDHIEDYAVTEDFIDSLTSGKTIDYLLGSKMNMFDEHILVNDFQDPILDGYHVSIISQIRTHLMNGFHDFYVNNTTHDVYQSDEWVPSVIFSESIAKEFCVAFLVFTDDGFSVNASIDSSQITINKDGLNLKEHSYFNADSNTYSLAMCKCILKLYYGFGVDDDNA